MELCKIDSKIIGNGIREIKIIGNFKLANILVVSKSGAINDTIEKSGIAHVCEHLFLKLVEKKYKEQIKDLDFKKMGFVDYTYTTLHFCCSSTIEHVEILLKSIIDVLLIEEFSIDLVNNVKKEVMMECTYRKKYINESLKMNMFLTNEDINYLPIGDKKQINTIDLNDIKSGFKSFISNINIIFLLNNNVKDINLRLVKNKLSNLVLQGNFKIENEYKKPTIKQRNQLRIIMGSQICEIKIFFLMKDLIDNKYNNLMKKVLEVILLNRFYNEIKNNKLINVNIFKKIISDHYKYICISCEFEDGQIDYSISTQIIKKILAELSYSEYKKACEMLKDFLKNLNEVNEPFVINSVLNYINFNENMLISKEKIKDIKKQVDKIGYNNLKQFKNILYTENYKIIIKNRS